MQSVVFSGIVGVVLGLFGSGVSDAHSPATVNAAVPSPCPDCSPYGGAFDVGGQVACGLVVNVQNIASSKTVCEPVFSACIPTIPDECRPILGFSFIIPAASPIVEAFKWGGGIVPIANGVISIAVAAPDSASGCASHHEEKYSMRDAAGGVVCVTEIRVGCTLCWDS